MHELPIPVQEARLRILAAAGPLGAVDVAVADALDRVLAETVAAAHDVPRFAVSAMDGFALRAGPAGRVLRIAGESRAGAPADGTLAEGEAFRISTGAAVPHGADAVVMVERTDERPDGTVLIEAEAATGQNVRGPGEDLRAGADLLFAGDRLSPAHLGVAINAGRATVRCIARPRVAVLATGDELTDPGAPLGPGAIHDSNGPTLAALARRAGADVVHVGRVRDTAEETRSAVAEALQMADVLLLSGGVSVGPHDHVKGALEACGVHEEFWRVALRPGQPTWFGTRGAQLIFGLPGNPVSAAVTFLLFARPALAVLGGATPSPDGAGLTARLGEAIPRLPTRTQAVRVHLEGGVAHLTGRQESHVFSSMLTADALAIIDPGEGEAQAGAEVAIELI